MADPRLLAPNKRRDQRSPYMQALSKASMGEKVNCCPFGCKEVDLDDLGYCCHLVGFTNDGETFHPLTRAVVEKEVKGRFVKIDMPVAPVRGNAPQEVLKDDVLVQITTSSRVYREHKSDEAKPAKK